MFICNGNNYRKIWGHLIEIKQVGLGKSKYQVCCWCITRLQGVFQHIYLQYMYFCAAKHCLTISNTVELECLKNSKYRKVIYTDPNLCVLAVQISSRLTYVTKTNPDIHIPVQSSSLKYLHSSSYGIQSNTVLFW